MTPASVSTAPAGASGHPPWPRLRPPTAAAFAFIFVTVLLDMVAIGIVVPVLPELVVSFRGGDASSGAAVYGVFGSVWAAMQFLFSPVLGSLSDRFGRRRVILLSNIGLGIDYVFMALAPTLGWLFVGRVISGITSSSYGTAGAYIADVTPPEQRAAKFGMLGAAFGVGFIVGPTLGGLLSPLGLRAPFWAAAALSLANSAYGFFILPESLPPDRRAPFHWKRANPVGSFGLLRSHPQLFGLAGAGFLSLAHDSLPSSFVLYANYRYQWDTRTVGLVLGGVGISSMIVQGGLVGRLVGWLGERLALIAGLVCGAIGFAVFGIAPTGAAFLSGIPFIALYGLANPALQSLMTRTVSSTEQGRLQGANGSLMGIASMVVAPLVFTQVFAAAIGPYKDAEMPGLPFALAAVLVLAAVVVGWRVTRPNARAAGT
jgi:MFS transporter, DHA1 family, tetracycline resistance protein